MNDNQEASCSTSSTKVRVNSKSRRVSRDRLPTPPPDPRALTSINTLDEVFISSNALDYIHSLQKTMYTSVIATEDAFNQLDKLYRLIEQMLDLRQQNARIFNRIRDIEHLKNLETMHHQVNMLSNSRDFEEKSAYAETLLDSMLSETKKDFKNKPWTRSRLTQSVMKRHRRPSARQDNDSESTPLYRQSSSGLQKPSKVSKWTKVKAAFRWEKASPSVTGAKSQDSGIGGMTPINFEIARYLRVPSSDDTGNSPADSGAADGSTPGSLSSASSNDEVHRQGLRDDSQCSDDDQKRISKKNLHYKVDGSIKRSQLYYDEHSNSNRSEDEKYEASDKEHSAASQGSSFKSNKKYVPRQNTKTQIPDDVVERYRKALADEENVSKNSNRKRVSKWVRVKKAFLNPSVDDQHIKSPSPVDKDILIDPITHERNQMQTEIQDNYKQLQQKLSLEFKGKLREWEKLKSSTCNTNPSSSYNTRMECSTEEPRDPAFAKKMEEWEKIKTQPVKPIQLVREEDLPPDFKKKLDEWQRIKKSSTKDDLLSSGKTKKKLGEWPRWKSISGHREEHSYNDPQTLSDDFLKKLEEWRKIKDPHRHNDPIEKTPSPNAARKQSITITPPNLSPKPDHSLQWFESELNKIEMERKRLESERHKFLQREERLAKLRRTVLGNENKKDVLVHTPSGFYKFEGISRKFTQKLCEWETSQGIGPEASTFALLTSSFTPHITVNLCEKETQGENVRLPRSKSAESVAISHLNEAIQSKSPHPSSLSLNDIDELERQCLALSSTNSSYQNVNQSFENVDNDEPEAVIVEVEDVVEETADVLEEYLEEKHFPIYQRESLLNTCEEQLVVVPDIQEATRTTNPKYVLHLLEDIIQLSAQLKNKGCNTIFNSLENLYRKTQIDFNNGQEPDQLLYTEATFSKNDGTSQSWNLLHKKLSYLKEIHLLNIPNVNSSNIQKPTALQIADFLDSTECLFAQLLQMTRELQGNSNCSKAEYSLKTNSVFGKLRELKQVFTDFYQQEIIATDEQLLKSNLQAASENVKDLTLKEHDKEIEVDPAIIKKLVISTSTNYLNANEIPPTQQEPTSIFVNTTRRLFTPFEETEVLHFQELQGTQKTEPESPTSNRKLQKEISPGIRVMLAKYNQMITQQDQPKAPSGSSSPIWRSPVSERRVKAKRERYIEEVSRIKEQNVKKSASSTVLNLNYKPECNNNETNMGILRSTSASVIQHKIKPLTIIKVSEDEVKQACNERNSKLQKAKEEFMRSPDMIELPPEPCSAPPTYAKDIVFSTRSRFSRISVGSESSYDSTACALVKSASVGMINIDEHNYRHLDTAVHQYGYLSLPRVVTKHKSGIFEGLSNIAARFRKVKMKRNKKMATVSALCRQSLVVDLGIGSHENVTNDEHVRHDSLTVPTPSSSEDTSPSSSRSGSWIRKSRIFKAL